MNSTFTKAAPAVYNNTTFHPESPGIDVFKEKSGKKDFKTVYGEFHFTRVGNPITQINTRKEGLKSVDPHFVANVALNEAGAKYFKNQGFNIREGDDGIPSPHIKLKRLVKSEETKIDIFDKDGKPMDPKVLIGNGSKGSAYFRIYDLEDGTKNGALMAIQINELVEYVSGEKSSNSSTKPKWTPKTASAPTTAPRKPVSYAGGASAKASTKLEDDLDDELTF